MSESMKLPEGKTCGDCAWQPRCEALFMCKPEWTNCDFYPIRFYPKSIGASAGEKEGKGEQS